MLLGRDWIHANCCIPSTMHQCLVQWVGDSVEVVKADAPFSIATAEALPWNYDQVICISGQAIDSDFLRMADFGMQPIQAVGSEKSS